MASFKAKNGDYFELRYGNLVKEARGYCVFRNGKPNNILIDPMKGVEFQTRSDANKEVIRRFTIMASTTNTNPPPHDEDEKHAC